MDFSILTMLLRKLVRLRGQLTGSEKETRQLLRQIHPSQVRSARNLIHYLRLRRTDLRVLQTQLTGMGLSSLGRSEAHVMATLDAVLKILHRLSYKPWPRSWTSGPVSIEEGRTKLKTHTLALLGPKSSGRWVRIMATMPREAADNPELVRRLLASGMNCMRVNCAHDDVMIWRRMVKNLRRAERELGKKCKVLFDLGGPKVRTGPLGRGPQVLKWGPERDAFGRVVIPARLWLTPQEWPTVPPSSASAVLPLPKSWLKRLKSGDEIRLIDARGSSRKLLIKAVERGGCWAECRQSAYVEAGTLFRVHSKKKSRKRDLNDEAQLSVLSERDQPILLHLNDELILTRRLIPGHGAMLDPKGCVVLPAQIGCTAPRVFHSLKPGQRAFLDDGKIGGVITVVEKSRVRVRITHARPKGEKLYSDKGINFPDTQLRLPSLSQEDREDLKEIVDCADLVGYSFVQSIKDVGALQRELKRLRGKRLGVILKIETRAAFENLPELLLASMRAPCVGVMIARGDLAVECGYERMAEIQEEILWVCEAAHVPVIWATQVLESLSRAGIPTRAEVTDAAMGVRAECVMLNKGPEMVSAVRALDNILRRMQTHQNKKQSMLRALRVARKFVSGNGRLDPGLEGESRTR